MLIRAQASHPHIAASPAFTKRCTARVAAVSSSAKTMARGDRHDWFRNTDWNDEIAAAFEARLSRAREIFQYLRIQADTLAKAHPVVALALLERYFALGINIDNASGFVAQATAYLALGDIDAALLALQHALVVERARPNVQTNAWSSYVELVVTLPRPDLFDDVLAVLDEKSAQVAFPVSTFTFHAARAVVYAARGLPDAREVARLALEAAAATRSGFARHPTLGLVSARHDALRARVQQILEHPAHAPTDARPADGPPARAIAIDRRGSPAAEALLAEIRRDTTFATNYAEQDAARAAKRAALLEAEAPLVRALQEVGVSASSVWNPALRPAPNRAALLVLLRHLAEPYPSVIRDGIARALACREARFARPELKQRFEQELDPVVKSGLALALGATSDRGDVPDLVEILKDDRHGTSRIMLLEAVVRLVAPADADDVLDDLACRADLSVAVAAMKTRRERNRRQREKRLARRTLH